MKLLAFSDLHRDLGTAADLVERSADADLVIGAGDFGSVHEGVAATIAALAPISVPTLLVPGNNETEDELRAAVADAGWTAARSSTEAVRASTASSSSASAPAFRRRPGTGAST